MTRRMPVVERLTVSGAVLATLAATLSIGNTLSMPRLRRPVTVETNERVVVCVPARDEETTLPLLIGDLRAQTYPGELRVIVLDDESRDGTLDAAHRAAGEDSRIVVESNTLPPPPGWTGKAAACLRLADLAFAGGPPADVIAFVDADVRLSPDAITATVAELRRRGAALVCPWPEQYADSIAERLLQPLLSFSWMSTTVVAAANRSLRQSLAVACGQFLMFDAAAYRRIGGHEPVASSVTEDLAIARVLRRHGERTVLVSGAGFVGCRMYRNWTDLRMGYTRWLWSAFGGRAGSSAVFTLAAVTYLLPAVVAVLGSGRVRRVGTLGYLAGVIARLGSAISETAPFETAGGNDGAAGRTTIDSMVRHVASAGVHPLATVVFAGLVVDSHIRRARNTLSWKDRPLQRSTSTTPSRRVQKRKRRTPMSILDGAV